MSNGGGGLRQLLLVAGRGILELVYPQSPKCRLCSRQAASVDGHGRGRGSLGLCSLCYAGLLFLDGEICDTCGREMMAGSEGWAVKGEGVLKQCDDCRRRGREQTFFQSNRSAVAYNRMMKDLLALYKYRGNEQLQELLGELLHQAYRLHYAGLSVDAITYVPLHPQREKERGFNQSRQLAEGLGRKLSFPVRELLVRNQETDKQSMKTRRERIHALRGVFAAAPLPAHFARARQEAGVGDQVERQVLLIDDVYTTGSTVNECARVLMELGYEKIYVLTVAR